MVRKYILLKWVVWNKFTSWCISWVWEGSSESETGLKGALKGHQAHNTRFLQVQSQSFEIVWRWSVLEQPLQKFCQNRCAFYRSIIFLTPIFHHIFHSNSLVLCLQYACLIRQIKFYESPLNYLEQTQNCCQTHLIA